MKIRDDLGLFTLSIQIQTYHARTPIQSKENAPHKTCISTIGIGQYLYHVRVCVSVCKPIVIEYSVLTCLIEFPINRTDRPIVSLFRRTQTQNLQLPFSFVSPLNSVHSTPSLHPSPINNQSGLCRVCLTSDTRRR